jgi:hypothetical protein
MSERVFNLKVPGDSIRINGTDFELFVNAEGNIGLFFGDKCEDVRWIVEKRQEKIEASKNAEGA